MTGRMLACLTLATAMAAPATGQVEFYEESFQYDHDHPAVGDWLGNVEPGRSPQTWAALSIEAGEAGDAGAYTTTITLLSTMSINAHFYGVRGEPEWAALETIELPDPKAADA